MNTSSSSHVAEQDWFTRAHVRITRPYETGTPLGTSHRFMKDEELELVQWGRAGEEVDRSTWWSGFEVDSAFIVPADDLEVLSVIEEKSPWTTS
ncbi:MAG: hypothetical protein HOQ05_12255 [Corynebacteriales bacterium]|nr:hypothetical protein [Mycobacteriales bacterium]